MNRFGLTLTKTRGAPAFALAIGWDLPVRLFRPYLSLQFLGWFVCFGWSNLLQKAVDAGAKEGLTYVVAYGMRRDYWDRGAKVVAGRIHDCEADEERKFLIPNLLHEAGVMDGDEFEVVITRTGRRPHGDRLFIRDPAGRFRAETDDECVMRIAPEEMQHAAVQSTAR